MTGKAAVDRPEGDLARDLPAAAAPTALPRPSMLRAWWALVLFSFQRQARAHQMVWIALGLLAFTATLVALNTAADRWGMWHWRWRWSPAVTSPLAPPPRPGMYPGLPPVVSTYQQTLSGLGVLPAVLPWPAPAVAVQEGTAAVFGAVLERSGFFVFSNWVVFSIYLSFLLPVWSLSFATEALGSEREARSLVWLLTRPLPRPAIYLAKFTALLPWALGLNLGGFALLCVLAGQPGRQALALFWPAVFWATLAFCALYHLFAAAFRRAAVVALIYSFFLETILGNMPGLMKRVSIGFYARCMMFDVAQDQGLQPVKPSVYLPVSGTTALWVLVAATAVLLVTGMFLFARTEYQDLT